MAQDSVLIAVRVSPSLKLEIYKLFPDVKVRNQKIRELLNNLVKTKSAFSGPAKNWQKP